MISHKNGLRLHVINVGHGDAILVELPDRDGELRFGLVDAGGRSADRSSNKTRDYLDAFVRWRMQGAEPKARFEFLCLTHPHDDHYTGMLKVLEWAKGLGLPPREFWDCGFRCTSIGYLKIIKFLCENDETRFMRVASGTEFHYGPVEIMVLAPSVDLRNRFDTHGVEANNASIVLRVRKGQTSAILASDAEYLSWGKIVEEFPRTYRLTYPKAKESAEKLITDIKGSKDPNLVMKSAVSQLGCSLLKMAHHGSKNGTGYEYLERLGAEHYAITCASDKTYSKRWKGGFPHPLTRLAVVEATTGCDKAAGTVPSLCGLPEVGLSVDQGTMIYTMGGRKRVVREDLGEKPSKAVTPAMIQAALG